MLFEELVVRGKGNYPDCNHRQHDPRDDAVDALFASNFNVRLRLILTHERKTPHLKTSRGKVISLFARGMEHWKSHFVVGDASDTFPAYS